MRIWAISDTHLKHGFLDIPLEGIDMLIVAGDMGTYRDAILNHVGVYDTLTWIQSLAHIKYKVVIAGNHDTSIENGYLDVKASFPDIIYLKHESVTIEGVNIFGSPYTPSFGTGWAFNVPRQKLDDYWKQIPTNTDILVTHGPPKGILDLTEEGHLFFQCGCKALLRHVKEIEPKYHIFGHIHTEADCPNSGILEIQHCKTKFVNASVVNLQYNVVNNGYILEI